MKNSMARSMSYKRKALLRKVIPSLPGGLRFRSVMDFAYFVTQNKQLQLAARAKNELQYMTMAKPLPSLHLRAISLYIIRYYPASSGV